MAILLHAASIEIVAAPPAADEIHTFDIPAGPLDVALDRFARTAGVNLFYDVALLDGLQSKGLSGNYSIGVVLSLLLAGSGIEATARSGGGYALRKAPVTRNSSGEAVVLPLMAVSATIASADGSADKGYRSDHVSAMGPWESRTLQDTPYSASVMSNELIENTIARDLDQLYKMNPVVQANASTTVWGYPNVVIRGFSQSASILDGVRLSSTTYGLSIEEIEKVEVLNGLSGFMYGAGNVGGVANYVLKRPTYELLAKFALGNYGGSQYFGHVDLGGTLTQDGAVAFRLNAAYADGGTSRDDQNLKKWLISGALDWNVTSNLLIRLEGAHIYWRLDREDTRFYASGFNY